VKGDKDESGDPKDKRSKAPQGAVWTVERDTRNMPRLRLIKGDAERGVTLEEAKDAAKEMLREFSGDEPLVTFSEQLDGM